MTGLEKSTGRGDGVGWWRRGCVIAGAVIAGAALLGLVVPPVVGTEPESRPAPAGPPVQAGRLVSAPEVSLAELSWRDYHGVLLPYSGAAGPREVGGDRAAGFARTPLGSLLAAVHIAVRANVQWGPKVFEPTIEEQVIGPDAEALLASTRAAYEELRGDRPDGAALGRGYVVLEGFRWQGYSPQGASVDLVSAGPGDSDVTARAVTRVQLRWQDGDWRVVGPPGGTWAGAASAIESPDGYVRLQGGGG
ncbi:hypothetical protein [Spirillospora sp. NPDC048819]|uniref:hypothetical protein n=1 Tax=Spirillospora sp. NPDC048819 TaxID=3155268 RepID=UPI00340B55EB